MSSAQQENPRAHSQQDSHAEPASAAAAPVCVKPGEEGDAESHGAFKPTKPKSDSSDGLSDSSDEESDSSYDGTSHSEDNDPTYTPNSFKAIPAMGYAMPKKRKRKSNGLPSRNAKKPRKSIAEGVAAHIHELANDVAGHADASLAPLTVDKEVSELSNDEDKLNNADDSFMRAILELEVNHEVKAVVGRNGKGTEAATEDTSAPNCTEDETNEFAETPSSSKRVESAPRERPATDASNVSVTKEVSVKTEPGYFTDSALDTQPDIEEATAQFKVEPDDIGPTAPFGVGSARQSLPIAYASNELNDLRRENEVLRKEKAGLEERLKRSDNKLKESEDDCASLQQRLNASEAATEAASRQVQELETKLAKCNALITDLTLEARGIK